MRGEDADFVNRHRRAEIELHLGDVVDECHASVWHTAAHLGRVRRCTAANHDMQRSDFRFFERLRVRWAEIDQQKIVFNGHYLMYFDTAITGYWRALALPYAQTLERLEGLRANDGL